MMHLPKKYAAHGEKTITTGWNSYSIPLLEVGLGVEKPTWNQNGAENFHTLYLTPLLPAQMSSRHDGTRPEHSNA